VVGFRFVFFLLKKKQKTKRKKIDQRLSVERGMIEEMEDVLSNVVGVDVI
jgi:hypothetical protein